MTTLTGVVSYPIPPYSNLPINICYYKPRQFFISAIGLGPTTLITTTLNHDYVIGQLCRLIIPSANGTYQLNEKRGYVLSIPATNQVILDIDSTNFDVFNTSTQPTQPQILGIGDINSGNISTHGNVCVSTLIPGSYHNISPF